MLYLRGDLHPSCFVEKESFMILENLSMLDTLIDVPMCCFLFLTI